MTRRPLIEPVDIADGFLVLDARPADAFAASTYPGAAHVPVADWERDAKTAAGSLGEPFFWAERIGALGIDGSRPLAVFDDGRMTEAARVWFILQHFGATAHVVNGGWPAVEATLGAAVRPGDLRPVPSRFVPMSCGLVRLMTKSELRRAIGTRTQILDARTWTEFAGEDRRDNPRGGHLPGARNLPHGELLDAEGRVWDRATLIALFEQAGCQVDAPLVAHCQGGGRAALAALAAVEVGYTDVGVYYLSFAEWARDEACPVKIPDPA